MNISHSIPSTVSSISFSFLSSEDIRRISVKQIVNPILLDDLNRPNAGGLYDSALGPSDKQDMYVFFVNILPCIKLNFDISAARHVVWHISLAQVISVISNSPPQYFIPCSWWTCSTCFVEPVFSVTASKLVELWCVYLPWQFQISL